MFSFVRHFLQTKGLGHGLERSLEVIWRFTLGGRRLDRITDRLEEILGSSRLRITFFVSAGVIARHRTRVERLQRLGHEIGSHGVHHSRMDLLDRSRQVRLLNESRRLLEEAGFEPKGFRSPYLSYNQDTCDVLKSGPFLWTSGRVILWDHQANSYPWVGRLGPLYHFLSSQRTLALPQMCNQVLDIPVHAPDDEMLYERCRVRDTEGLSAAWTDLFDVVHERGELCHVMFHPERFPYTSAAIGNLIEHVAKARPSVWMGTLGEIGAWWNERKDWQWTRLDGKTLEVRAPERSTFLVKSAGDNCPSPLSLKAVSPLFGDYCIAERSAKWPAWTVSVSRRSPESLLSWLKEEGFCAEYVDETSSQDPLLDQPEFDESHRRTLLRKLDSARVPLFRLWRWPNGCRSAFCLSADICAVDLRDFFDRMRHFG